MAFSRNLCVIEPAPAGLETRGLQDYDFHVRAFYSQPASAHPIYRYAFAGETYALADAYCVACDIDAETLFTCENAAPSKYRDHVSNGRLDDDFGSTDEGGYWFRVVYDGAPFLVCGVVNSDGFVSEVGSDAYEAAWAAYVEANETEEAQ